MSKRHLKTVVAALVALPLVIGSAASASGTSVQDSLKAQKPASSQDAKDKYKDKAAKAKKARENVVTQAEREEAAADAQREGALNPLMQQAVGIAATPGEAPRYFSHPNYANSPLPQVTQGQTTTVGNPLADRQYASDNASDVLVVLDDSPLPAGLISSFETWNQATAGGSDQPSAGLSFHAYVLRPTGSANAYSVVFDSGQLTVPALADAATSAAATFPVANLAVQAGDVLAFYGRGIPFDLGPGTDTTSHPAVQPVSGETLTIGSASHPNYSTDRVYSFRAGVTDTSSATISGGMRKFVDTLPTIQVATPDTTTYPGSDYYEIGLVEYTQKMHADLPATKLRGYVQLNAGTHTPSYLGPTIVAQKDRPVRILFRNKLPIGTDGNLFLPVDSTVMGSGMTADGHTAAEANPGAEDPQNPMCTTTTGDGSQKTGMVAGGHCYSENRATLHLHGGITPWISDGTPHQWITPSGETTEYPAGVSVENVPDMPDPGPGAQTFFYTNAQSARLMFYHDHSWGITRLNVYAGEAAPYIITDATEKALVDSGTLPGADSTIPLVFQDKTFVPAPAQLADQDETWNSAAWGGEGSLWLPHVYSPAQNPGDASGVNAFGRWAYGPWFWPPTNNVENGPMPNPYYDPTCDAEAGWCEPPLMPGTPYNSMGMESFMDTPVVNGMAYPTVTLQPKAYRFRILNAANDRFMNLSMYKAVDAKGVTCDAANPNPAPESTGVACTEVALNPGEVAAALEDPTIFPTPVAGTEGPSWVVVGTEGGFLPTPAEVAPQPTTWVTDPTVFNAGNVDKHSLLVAPAERFDVVVDLSKYAGQTLIVYNDAPAAFPARDARYDYYTGNADLRESGGAPSTLPGYGPNTRTTMQIKVAGTPAPAFDRAKLDAAFAHTAQGTGVFEKGQKPIIVGQGEYNKAYGTTFATSGPTNGTVQIYDTTLTFDRLIDGDAATAPGAPFTTSTAAQRLSMTFKPKMIQDEMGEAFEHEYGRMSGFLGVETPNAQAGLQNMILSPFTAPPTEVLRGVELPPGMSATPLASADDGTQIWKITHNGVDTHPIHFHLFDVQLLNRVGWDGILRKADPTELGWKDTVRVSPLEDTIVALRPIVPQIPSSFGGLPNSIRLLDPSMPEGAWLSNTTAQEAAGLPIFAFNPDGEPVDVVNHFVNYGWEYVYHCHILSHEEMDMMHAVAVGVAPPAPGSTTISGTTGNGQNRANVIAWADRSKNETAFVIQRRVAGTTQWTTLATVPSDTKLGSLGYKPGIGATTGPRTYRDVIGNDKKTYQYNVYAINTVGDTWDYSNPNLNNIAPGGGFPTLTLDSRGGSAPVPEAVGAPTKLAGKLVVKNKKTSTVTLTWTDNATNETGFLVQRINADGSVTNENTGPNATTFTQSVASGVSVKYRVLAVSSTSQSAWSNTITLP